MYVRLFFIKNNVKPSNTLLHTIPGQGCLGCNHSTHPYRKSCFISNYFPLSIKTKPCYNNCFILLISVELLAEVMDEAVLLSDQSIFLSS